MTQAAKTPLIAFLGTGLMGAPMAKNLLAAGFRLRVWNRSPAKAEALASHGAEVAATPATAVEGADVVISILSDAPAVREVMFGDAGYVAHLKPGALTIDQSSLAPDLSREIHEKLAALGVAHLDAPVSGGVAGAEAGTLAILVGGSTDDFNRAAPVFSAMGTGHHLGYAGAGQVGKLVNQAIVHVTIGAVSEGLLLAEALGVDAGKVRDAIAGGFCQSRILDIHGARMVARDFRPGGASKFALKDLRGAMDQAAGANLELPLSAQVTAMYQAMVDGGQGDVDHAGLLLAYERANAPHRVSPDTKDKL